MIASRECLEPGQRGAERSGHPDRIARPRAAARRDGDVARPPDRGKAVASRRVARYRVAAEQGHAVMPQRGLQSGNEARLVLAAGEADEDADRPRALGREVGEVGRDEFPRHVGGVLPPRGVHPFDQHVVGQHQRFAPDLEHGRVVVEISRPFVQRKGAQALDQVELPAHRTCLATASSMPLTNFASRSSKKALATSTYSLIAVPTGTSARAISS